jgi:hypothetical protein
MPVNISHYDGQSKSFRILARTQISSIYLATVRGVGGRLILESSGIRFDALIGCETCALETHFQSREQPKVTRSEIRRVRWLGDDTTSDVWLGTLS